MASTAPQNAGLPLLYKDLMPLSSVDHADWKMRALDHIAFAKGDHAIPVTVDEFAMAQRHYPIVFSVGDNPVPLALMGLNEGVNTFIDDDGKVTEAVYLPAYLRRYPFLLAKLRPEAEELSLCFDPTTEALGAFDEGEPLFDGDKPTDVVTRILGFCQEFEESGMKTGQFMAELAEHGLLMDGEVSIQPDGESQPFIYRGFQMVDETKLRDLRGDVLRKMMQSGLLPLIHAHLFSLQTMREIFGRQVMQGKTVIPTAPDAAA
ncbi:SapC family protein [Sphingomonas sp. SUN039]|uniref:SapC family protein n=1 Tax=Sphingomonas sp. SUN039 TaxID=2937787 RepID=UPI002164B75E|nr:SapC family protein [Sphingomonas sp. SUN039]UVO54624.1 SapC family protein [Sphingomonas sp. SUN039]